MSITLRIILLAIIGSLLLASCASSRSVSRVSADSDIDLSGRWNDKDSKLVADEMISDVIKRGWLSDFTDDQKRKPVVIVGSIRNRSSEHIDSRLFTKDIERSLINAGKVKFVANDSERGEIRDERMSQQTESNPDTIKRLGQETGADFILQGTIDSVSDAVEGQKVVFYEVDLELINIETNEKVWIGSKKIKKLIEQDRVRF